MLFELWLTLRIPRSVLDDSPIALAYVSVARHVLPVIAQLERAAGSGAALFFVALSPFLLVPKLVFWLKWLRSDKLRILRYFVVSPLTSEVPKRPFDFVLDPLRSESTNLSPRFVEPIGLGRRIFISVATLMFVVGAGFIWPWMIYGVDIARQHADARVLATMHGGWQMWLSWSVYQMNLAAFFLALGYCVVADYVTWFRAVFQGTRARRT